MIHTSVLALLLLLVAATGATKHNILFLASDDMRPELSVYGHDYMSTPHLQGLADDGFFFRRAYVQQALCAPSRTVILTGRRPDTSRVWTIGPYFRDTTLRNVTTLPQFFKQRGWRAIGHGKIFHEGSASGAPLDQDQEYGSWSVPYFHPKITYDKFNESDPNPAPGVVRSPLSNGGLDEPWQTFNDAKSALTAVEWIKNASAYEEPFFLAVGFHRPHIPYIYPKEFEFKGDVSFPPQDYAMTTDVPPCAPHDWTGEGLRYADLYEITPNITAHDIQKNLSSLCDAVPLAKQAEMKRSYLSAVQYVDHLVGVLTQALKDEELYDETSIIFWGDHGYKLGEHCDWFKHDNYEDSTRIPVIIKPAASVQGLRPRGAAVEQLVEELDIFPSLAELTGLKDEAEATGVQGKSWVPLLRPGGEAAAGKSFVFSQYPHFSEAAKHLTMGYSMRTPAYRYTEWVKFDCNAMSPMNACSDKASVTPQWENLVGVELYNHTGNGADDFGKWENENLAHREEAADVVDKLRAQLHAKWVKPQV